jgi:hypothetical protein
MLQKADSRRRFVMPKNAAIMPNSPADIEVLPDGRIMITPVLIIPVHEQRWHTQESLLHTEKSEADAAAGRVMDADTLVNKIDERLSGPVK